MGEKLPVISGKDLVKFFLKNGCELKRVKGSHHVILSKLNNQIFVVPVHSNEKIDRGLLKAIIKQSGLDMDQFIDMIKV